MRVAQTAHLGNKVPVAKLENVENQVPRENEDPQDKQDHPDPEDPGDQQGSLVAKENKD